MTGTTFKSAVGVAGTTLAALTPESAAAIFAGIGTGVFMFTQTIIAVRNHRRKARARVAPKWMKRRDS
jgi:hypothetical protein